MTWIRLIGLSLRQLLRSRVRTTLTLLGAFSGLFLFVTVETFQSSLQRSTTQQAGDDILVVYRDKRFCPFTSRLPEDYGSKIRDLPGVKSVTPVKVVVNHCGTGLDTITFRGIPESQLTDFFKGEDLNPAAVQRWKHQKDSSLVGEQLALRRGLKEGDLFDAAGVSTRIAGILSSDDPQKVNSAFLHLSYLQQVAGTGLGQVTQFNVRVHDPQSMDQVAKTIDERFRYDREPTHTRPEKAFVAQTASEMLELVRFTRALGIAAVLAVLLLMVNTIAIAVRGRQMEMAVLQALGYRSFHLFWMILCEGLILGCLAAAMALAAATAFLHWFPLAISSEGLSLSFNVNDVSFPQTIAMALSLGLLAGLLPALGVLRGDLVQKLRAA